MPSGRLWTGKASAVQLAAKSKAPLLAKSVRNGHTVRLTFHKLPQHFDDAGPAAGVILAGDGQIGEAAVRDFQVRAGGSRREFPADDGAARGVVMPVGDPCIDEQARRIALENLPVTFELADAVDYDGTFFGFVAIAAADVGIHLPGFHRTLGTAEPAFEFASISEGLKDARGRSGDFDFADD